MEVSMLKTLSKLFRPKNKKNSSDNSVKEEPIETKKCKKCLRRVGFEFSKCPYCGSFDFHEF